MIHTQMLNIISLRSKAKNGIFSAQKTISLKEYLPLLLTHRAMKGKRVSLGYNLRFRGFIGSVSGRKS